MIVQMQISIKRNPEYRGGGDSMKKILFKTILFLTFTGLLSQALAQGEEDFEKAGRQHFDNAYFKAIPHKNKTMADVEFTLAEKAFQKAIEKKPQQVKAYLYLGRTYSAQKKYAAAAETYRSALMIAPQQKKIYLRLASALEKAGDSQGAINALEELRALESDDRAIRIIDDFIGKMEKRAARTDPDNSQSGELP
jgi:cytochrome c-type biogenesis protein CcmH/NrfG